MCREGAAEEMMMPCFRNAELIVPGNMKVEKFGMLSKSSLLPFVPATALSEHLLCREQDSPPQSLKPKGEDIPVRI